VRSFLVLEGVLRLGELLRDRPLHGTADDVLALKR
jgi:hypothetical protein